jgi:hypothetical protein
MYVRRSSGIRAQQAPTCLRVCACRLILLLLLAFRAVSSARSSGGGHSFARFPFLQSVAGDGVKNRRRRARPTIPGLPGAV